MATTAESIGVAPFELDEAEAGITEHTMGRMGEVQALVDEGESEENIARFIVSNDDFTQAERVLARIVLRRHGLARGS
jgi:hypothetical protein